MFSDKVHGLVCSNMRQLAASLLTFVSGVMWHWRMVSKVAANE